MSYFRTKRKDETRLLSIDFTDKLGTDETLDSVEVDEVGTSALTLTDEEVNTEIIEINYKPVQIGKAASVFVAGGVIGVDYTIRMTCTSDLGQIVIKDRSFRVNK